MRAVGLVVVVCGALAAVSAADAQGLGRRGGNQQQQNTGGITPTEREEKRFPLGQSWIAVSFNGKPFAGTERPAFTLDEQFRVRGFGGCNSFSATAFPLREQGIAVGPLALTRKNCDAAVMTSERNFLTALRTSAKWETSTGSLVVRGPNGELKFERAL